MPKASTRDERLMHLGVAVKVGLVRLLDLPVKDGRYRCYGCRQGFKATTARCITRARQEEGEVICVACEIKMGEAH